MQMVFCASSNWVMYDLSEYVLTVMTHSESVQMLSPE